MEIPIGRTYTAHAAIGLVGATVGALLLLTKLGRIEFGSVQALGMLLALFVGLPAGLFAAYSALIVVVTLLSRRHAPRDMIVLPLVLIVAIAWGTAFARFETPLWTALAYLPLAGYVVMTLMFLARHRAGLRPRTKSLG